MSNIQKIEGLMREIIEALDLDLSDPNLEGTPYRIAKMYVNEIFKNRNNENIEELKSSITLFPNEDGEYNNVVRLEGIPFNSSCSHHFLPFSGFVDVEYVPSDYIIGLSKIPRIIKFFSKKPQLQENLVKEIGEFIIYVLNPKYLKVTVKAYHSCVGCRGAESDCLTTTYYERGVKGREVKEEA